MDRINTAPCTDKDQMRQMLKDWGICYTLETMAQVILEYKNQDLNFDGLSNQLTEISDYWAEVETFAGDAHYR